MLSTRIFGLACAVAVFVCLLAAPVSAQPLDSRPLFTFGGAGSLPGGLRFSAPDSSSQVGPVLSASLIGAAQSADSKGATYQWSGELVAVDSTASTLTLKSRIAYQEAVSEAKQFKPGEKVWILWSGSHDYSDAVRQIRHASAGNKIDEDLVMPAEFVSSEAPNQYVTIRVKVPERSLGAIKDVKPGQWLTLTSRHRPATEAEAVVAVKPYVSTTS